MARRITSCTKAKVEKDITGWNTDHYRSLIEVIDLIQYCKFMKSLFDREIVVFCVLSPDQVGILRGHCWRSPDSPWSGDRVLGGAGTSQKFL